MQELKGLADGSGQSLEDVVVFCIGFATFLFEEECLELSAWGPATVHDSLIHLRSYDIPLDCQDPETGRYIQQNQIIIVRKPELGYHSLYPSFAGDIFCKGGINNQGLAVSC